ncbi:hypothetical protein B0H15DRAFT_1010004 [Mycena belliarum]|uniref:Uncharacterized protein n=1 Tax=Mycena belliarum TaxID=1033014 RepID=A0AAD6XJK0_9AGAR|nr:hypothetical protein B0H15DRAFT_1010004 [Mycena belliae]
MGRVRSELNLVSDNDTLKTAANAAAPRKGRPARASTDDGAAHMKPQDFGGVHPPSKSAWHGYNPRICDHVAFPATGARSTCCPDRLALIKVCEIRAHRPFLLRAAVAPRAGSAPLALLGTQRIPDRASRTSVAAPVAPFRVCASGARRWAGIDSQALSATSTAAYCRASTQLYSTRESYDAKVKGPAAIMGPFLTVTFQ